MNIRDRAQILSRNARETMRDCALSYRRARQQGDLTRMVTMLILATQLRRCAHGYLEAA